MTTTRSEKTKNTLIEAAFSIEEVRVQLIDASADPEQSWHLVPKAVANLVDVLALLQDEVLGEAKVVGLDFPTQFGTRYHRMQNG